MIKFLKMKDNIKEGKAEKYHKNYKKENKKYTKIKIKNNYLLYKGIIEYNKINEIHSSPFILGLADNSAFSYGK